MNHSHLVHEDQNSSSSLHLVRTSDRLFRGSGSHTRLSTSACDIVPRFILCAKFWVNHLVSLWSAGAWLIHLLSLQSAGAWYIHLLSLQSAGAWLIHLVSLQSAGAWSIHCGCRQFILCTPIQGCCHISYHGDPLLQAASCFAPFALYQPVHLQWSLFFCTDLLWSRWK